MITNVYTNDAGEPVGYSDESYFEPEQWDDSDHWYDRDDDDDDGPFAQYD